MNSFKDYKRTLEIKLPPGQSAFLWGARQTGKSTYLKTRFETSLVYDLLQSDLYYALLQEPQRLRQELLAKKPSPDEPVIIDEVQRIPDLLQEIHWLIENAKISFILCGSSARKLKRDHAHLLGGRAWRYRMFPLTSHEIPDFNLLQAMQRGLLPAHYPKVQYKKSIEAYVYDYLTEEIRAEGLTRNLPAFTKFLHAASYSNAQLVEYKNIASDCGVDAKTVKEYFEILVDTHLGYLITPFVKKTGRKTITATPKFYFFDIGMANYLAKSNILQIKGFAAGFSFENFILMELMACRAYLEKDFTLNYWRTKTQLEVDFILNQGQVCIETTVSERIRAGDIKGLVAMMEESSAEKYIVVCQEKRQRLINVTAKKNIMVLPWQLFLKQLWRGEII